MGAMHPIMEEPDFDTDEAFRRDEPKLCVECRNEYEIREGFAFLKLTQGKEAKIDIADIHLVSGHRWYATIGRHSFYAMSKERMPNGRRKLIGMHRLLMGEPNGLFIDHIDCDGLNNSRSNLRVATPQQNGQNKRLPRNSKSGLKGVSWHAATGKWRACIRHNRRLVSLGLHASKEDAHAAYAQAAAGLHGEFARAE